MSRWRVRLLNGELWNLAHLYRESYCHVFEDAGKYYLTAAAFETLDEPAAVDAVADELLERMNGAAELAFGAHEEAVANAVEELNPDGSVRQSLVFASAEFAGKSRFILGRDTGPAAWVEAAEADSKVSTALKLIRRDPGRWGQLYKLYELVLDEAARQESQVVHRGWGSAEELKRFRETANDRRAAGLEARHYQLKSPAESPMALDEAEAFVRKLVVNWLRSRVPDRGTEGISLG